MDDNKATRNPNSEDYDYWREKQREQLGTYLNILMVLSSGAFGFLYDKTSFDRSLDAEFYALLAFLMSLMFSVLANFTRLYDFRTTAQAYKLSNCHAVFPADCRCTALGEAKMLGKCTWWLLHGSWFFLFSGAVILFVLRIHRFGGG